MSIARLNDLQQLRHANEILYGVLIMFVPTYNDAGHAPPWGASLWTRLVRLTVCFTSLYPDFRLELMKLAVFCHPHA